jgi:hypothetical protein
MVNIVSLTDVIKGKIYTLTVVSDTIFSLPRAHTPKNNDFYTSSTSTYYYIFK